MAIKRRFQERLSARKRELVDSVELFRALSPSSAASDVDGESSASASEPADMLLSLCATGPRRHVASVTRLTSASLAHRRPRGHCAVKANA